MAIPPGFLKFDGFKWVVDEDIEGEAGPIGPAGPTGSTGSVGPVGPAGNGDNATAFRSSSYNKAFLGATQAGFYRIFDTGMVDTSPTNYAGADLFISDTRLHVTGTLGGVDGQHYSMDLVGYTFDKDFDLRNDYSPFASIGNPSVFLGFNLADNFFNSFAIASDGIISNYIYRSFHSTGNDSNIGEEPPGGENWAGARGCYLYKTYDESLQVMIYWTAPNNDKVWMESAFFEGIQSVSFPGETPKAVCSDDDGYLWVAFNGSKKLRKYKTGSTTSDYGTMTQMTEFNLPADATIIDMTFDGKYVWALSNQGSTFQGIFKVDKTDGIVSTFNFHADDSDFITDNSRMLFDGSRIWVTGINRIYAFSAGDKHTEIVQLFDNFISGEGRGITCDKDGNIYVAVFDTFGSATLKIFKYVIPDGNPPLYEKKHITWTLSSNPTFHPISPFIFLSLPTTSYQFFGRIQNILVDVVVSTFDNADYARWSKNVLAVSDGATWTIVSSVDVVTPFLSAGATSQGWNITFTGGSLLTGTITHGTQPFTTIWTISITRMTPDFAGGTD